MLPHPFLCGICHFNAGISIIVHMCHIRKTKGPRVGVFFFVIDSTNRKVLRKIVEHVHFLYNKMIKALVMTNFYKMCKVNNKILAGPYQQAVLKNVGDASHPFSGGCAIESMDKARGPWGYRYIWFGPRGHMCADVENRNARSIREMAIVAPEKIFLVCAP